MILETLELVADWLADPTNGVNAKLPGIPIRAGQETPPAVALIADETRNVSACLGQLPAVPVGQDGERGDASGLYPCLLVSMMEPARPDPHTKAGEVQDADIEVLIRYGVLQDDVTKGSRDAHYTLRAVQRSLNDFLAAPEASRQLNGVFVWYRVYLDIVPIWQSDKDAIVTTGLRCRFKVRDSAP